MFVACGIRCLADVSSVNPLSEQTLSPCKSEKSIKVNTVHASQHKSMQVNAGLIRST